MASPNESDVMHSLHSGDSTTILTPDSEAIPLTVNSTNMKSKSETGTVNMVQFTGKAEKTQKVLDSDHPLMIKYQKDLKERLLVLLQGTEEQLLDLKRNISAQESENKHFAVKGYELQKELKRQEERLKTIQDKSEKQTEIKSNLLKKCEGINERFQSTEETWHVEVKKDNEFQTKLEDAAFEVVQLTSLQAETFTDAKTLKSVVDKTTKDRENLEVQKLRQDYLISRLENDRFKLEDKIHLYKTQCSIKKEEVTDLRKELNAAISEIEVIHFEKQQIVHQWRQSIASLSKQDCFLSEIRASVRKIEDYTSTLNMDIISYKKSVRKELERNEQLTLQLQMRESDIARVQRELKDAIERGNDLEENVSVMDKTVEITEQELKQVTDVNVLKEKELEGTERDLQKVFTQQKCLEKKHMDMLHEKMTITKASRYTEKLIKDTRNTIAANEGKGAKKENEKEKLLLKLDNLQTYLKKMEKDYADAYRGRAELETLLEKSESNVLKVREKLDSKRGELRSLENELKEMISKAGGQELAPFERELSNLRKEINIAEQGKRNMEQEYLRFQHELFSYSKQSSVKSEENDFYLKKIALMEGKKMQLEADIAKEEKEIKDVQNRMNGICNEITHLNKILAERNEAQENLLQTSTLSKCDYVKILKEAELRYIQMQNELKFLRRKKRKNFQKLIKVQNHIVYWEGKVQLAEETRKILKSESHVSEFSNVRSEIRRLQVKHEQMRKELQSLVQDMERAVYRHTSMYVEADKQALFGKRRKTPEYVQKRIKHAQKKIKVDKKELDNCIQQVESLRISESELSNVCEEEHSFASELIGKIKSMEYDIDSKEKEKRQAVIKLSFKQKKTRFLQKILDGTYIRAVRNEERRLEEIEKLQTGLCAIQVITEGAINEYPDLEKVLNKVLDYIVISKEL